ncbi:TBP-associated factor 9 domain-containing protein [Aureispira anguillae]|uniref:Uncharacterized protein n=1 Tax=Aureispira anguillae TaxID=2864201 RepID=A0A915YD41_9BACT|nr:hypothetical protein [Aureispira anguillae]BDS10860.1 hypothetical protein AsAng_0015700 [Aureispira anguillae]
MSIKNWIAKTDFEQLLATLYRSQNAPQWRILLFKYAYRYQDTYPFDCLEDAFAFLEEELKGNNIRVLLTEELEEIQTAVSYAMGEYCFSLTEIAAVVNRLLNTEPLSQSEIQTMINHIWEAYSCNLNPSQFIEREDHILTQLVKKYISIH